MSRDPISILEPRPILGKGEVRHFELCVLIDYGDVKFQTGSRNKAVAHMRIEK